MKKYKHLVILIVLVFSSCVKDEDRFYEGFTFFFWNETGTEISGAKIFIGGVNNGVFVPVDSKVITPDIKVGAPDRSYFNGDNRWKPNLSLVKNIPSDDCYFLFKFDDGREELIKSFNNTNYSISLPSNLKIGGDKGSINITIRSSEVLAD